MIAYLDSSCLVRFYTHDGPSLPGWGAWDAAFASALVKVEVRLTLRRLLATRAMVHREFERAWANFAEFERSIEFVPVRDDLLAMAWEPAETPLRALDAIHLATARLVRDSGVPNLVFATHDRRLAGAASEFGFEVAGI